MKKYLTKQNFGTLIGLCIISLGSVFIGYKVGEHKQLARDNAAFTDALAFVQEQDLNDCRDVLDQEMLACVKLVDAKCGLSTPSGSSLNYTPNIPVPKMELHLNTPPFKGGEF